MRLLLTVFVTVVAVAHSSHRPVALSSHRPVAQSSHRPVAQSSHRNYRSPGGKVYHPHAEALGHTPLSYSPCRNGLASRSDGTCVYPKVSKDVYFFNAPQFEAPFSPPIYEPIPKVHYNYVFVKTADKDKAARPLIVPPAKQKTVVYLLSEKPGHLQQEVIEVPFQPTKPEVHYVGYQPGQNQRLPGVIDLQTALAYAESPGNLVNLGGSLGDHGNVGHDASFVESGNSLDSFGQHGITDLHGIGGGHHLGISGHFGGAGDLHLSTGLRGVSHGVPGHHDITEHGGISELHGVHYQGGSPFGHGFGEGFGGSFESRFHRDVRQQQHSSASEVGGTARSSVSSSIGDLKRSQPTRFVPSPRVQYQ